ncbi:u3 snorna associated [Fusarium longipes]|uniref:U3 snorna associated n=1 Tax=Fusarium longipes TaxID=694270 RepID=A0A395SZ99_9HYPO|nr:u3 snorna associated [Fusarium longipes]
MAPLTRKRKADQKKQPEETPVKTSTSDEKRKLPVRAKDGESGDMSSEQPKGTKVVFGDDDDMDVPAAPLVSSKPVAPAPQDEEESDDDSDDEAPEAVSTSKIASEIKKSNQAAQKAAQEQAAAEKRKRRERDDRFKQQAEERKKLEEQEKENAEKEASDEKEEPAESLIQRSRTQTAPNLLPAEFLTDSSSEDEAEDDDQQEERPRKRRVATVERQLARQNRGPKDERIGSTVFRVAQKTDERMVPKMKRQTKNHKDDLMKRNRSAVKPRSGFFVR